MLHHKFWQAFFALAPITLLLLTMIGYLVVVFSFISKTQFEEQQGLVFIQQLLGKIVWFVALGLLMTMISLGSLLYYIMHAVQNPSLKNSSLLVVWIVLFVLANGIGQPIYWIVEILGHSKPLNNLNEKPKSFD